MTLEKSPPTLFSIQRLTVELLGWLAFPIGLIALVYLLSGRSVTEKAATALILPTGLMCWIPLVYGFRVLIRGQFKLASFPLLVGLGAVILTNPLVSRIMMKTLEDRYVPIDLSTAERFDAIVVLGGGTHSNPYKLPQLSAAGDRLSFACRMYHLKLVDKIFVTGDPLLGTHNEEHLDQSLQAKQILLETGVKDSDIEEVDGTTTSEEMISLSKRKEWMKGKRCGLVTSAFHMRRAMKLADKNGLELTPIATDFRAYSGPISVFDFIPAMSALSSFEVAAKEYLGILIGR
jgi:uncharacterized SAM-binding protein YcdF (DUF218 family)